MQQVNQTYTSKKIYIVCGVILLVYLLGGNWTLKKFHEIFTEPMLLKECDPEEIIPQIEKTCGIDIPDTAKDILAAKNVGSWDSSEQDFVLRLFITSENIAVFIKSLPGNDNIVQKEYHIEHDLRNSKQLNQPAWFLEPIHEGIIFERISMPDAKGVIDLIYIDTTSSDGSLVYVLGSYIRGEYLQ